MAAISAIFDSHSSCCCCLAASVAACSSLFFCTMFLFQAGMFCVRERERSGENIFNTHTHTHTMYASSSSSCLCFSRAISSSTWFILFFIIAFFHWGTLAISASPSSGTPCECSCVWSCVCVCVWDLKFFDSWCTPFLPDWWWRITR